MNCVELVSHADLRRMHGRYRYQIYSSMYFALISGAALETLATKRAPGRRRRHGNVALWVRLSFGALLE